MSLQFAKVHVSNPRGGWARAQVTNSALEVTLNIRRACRVLVRKFPQEQIALELTLDHDSQIMPREGQEVVVYLMQNNDGSVRAVAWTAKRKWEVAVSGKKLVPERRC